MSIEEGKKKSPIIQGIKWVAVVGISGMLVAYFIFLDSSRIGGQMPVAGSVNGVDIYYDKSSAFGRYYERYETYYRNRGVDINDDVRRDIERYAFMKAAEEVLMHMSANRNSVLVSDRYLVDSIKQLYFTDSNGVFNPQMYQAYVLREARQKKIAIEREARKSILVETLRFELFENAKANALSVEEAYLRSGTKRTVEVVYCDAYVPVMRAEIASNALKEYFTQNITNFLQYDIAHIQVSSYSRAETLYNALVKNPAQFASFAKDKSEDESTRSTGGSLGALTSYEMPDEFTRALAPYRTKPATVIPPLFYGRSYHIIYLKGTKTPTFADMPAATVRHAYLASKQEYLLAQEKTRLRALLTKGDRSAAVVFRSAPFSFGDDALDQSGRQLPVSGESAFQSSAFSLAVGAESPVLDFERGVGIVRVVSAIMPPSTPKSNEIQTLAYSVAREHADMVSRAWNESEQRKARVVYKLDSKGRPSR